MSKKNCCVVFLCQKAAKTSEEEREKVQAFKPPTVVSRMHLHYVTVLATA